MRLAFWILLFRTEPFRAGEFFPQHLVLGLDLPDPSRTGLSARVDVTFREPRRDVL